MTAMGGHTFLSFYGADFRLQDFSKDGRSNPADYRDIGLGVAFTAFST